MARSEKKGVQFANNDDDLYEGFDDYNPYGGGHMYDDGAAKGAKTYGGPGMKTAGGSRNAMSLGTSFGSNRPDLQTRGGRIPTAMKSDAGKCSNCHC